MPNKNEEDCGKNKIAFFSLATSGEIIKVSLPQWLGA